MTLLFNSWQYALFFPVVFALYWALPHRFRVYLLLIASCYFYMSWNAKYIMLIIFTTLASYLAALMLEKTESQRTKKVILTLTLCACLGVLFVFKYFNFFAGAVVDFLNMFALHLHPATLRLLLPVGISFYTFQTLSYVIDVYRERVKPERNFIVYAVFVSYFPQLVAGPIERTNNLLPQIKTPHGFDYSQAVYGIKLMTWGFFKKLAVADVLASHVDNVFSSVHSYQGVALMIAVFFFTVQIYCDFSGYSDIARGCSKMLGIDLMENFRSPYFSTGIREFWSRWHISLSTWFRDYVYIPLGGSHCGKLRHNVNLMITFTVSGLWHGADWTFVVWGAVHGLGRIAENSLTLNREPHELVRVVRVIVTFVFVMTVWVFFRAESLNDAVYIFTHILYLHDNGLSFSVSKFTALPVTTLIICEYASLNDNSGLIKLLTLKNNMLRWSAYVFIGLITAFFAPKGLPNDFVYFQF